MVVTDATGKTKIMNSHRREEVAWNVVQRPHLLSRAHYPGFDLPSETREAVAESRHAAKEPELKETKKSSFREGFFVKNLFRR